MCPFRRQLVDFEWKQIDGRLESSSAARMEFHHLPQEARGTNSRLLAAGLRKIRFQR